MAGTALNDSDKSGAFVRKEAVYRNSISKDGPFPPAKGRYILYVSYACPWACRCLTLRKVKGLEDVIEVAVVTPIWEKTKPDFDEHSGWVFDPSWDDACTCDPIFGAKTAREIYDKGTPEGHEPAIRFSVPILLDKQTKTIVNNESSEIIRFFNSEFNEFAKYPERDFYPEAFREQIDAMNTRTYEPINNGVYKCGFAQSQEAYDEAAVALFQGLDDVEQLLSRQRWLIKGSGQPTEADIRLFQTIVRFDEVYVVHFKCAKKCIREYAAITAWMRDVYHTLELGVVTAESPTTVINMKHIRNHYFGTHRSINKYGIVPIEVGVMRMLEVKPEGRESLA